MKLKRLYFKHGAYYYVGQDHKWHWLGREEATALRRYAELVEVISRPKMRDLFERYLRDVVPGKSPLTQRDNLREMGNLTAVFGNQYPDEVKATDIYAYMDARNSKTRANRERALLSHVFTMAIRWGICTENPCRNTQAFEERPRDRYVTDEEYWKVHDAAPATVQRAMRIAVSTGLRLSDILALRSDQCRDDGLLVRPSKTRRKTGKGLLFRWTPELRDVLDWPETRSRPDPPVYLLVSAHGTPYTRDGFQAAWQRLMHEVFPEKADRFTFHDLRAKAGSDSDDGKLLGHADTRTLNRHYRRKPVAVNPIEIKR